MKQRNHVRNPGIYWSIILKWVMKEKGVRLWTRFIWLRAGFNGNESVGFKERNGEFGEQLSNY